MSKLKNGRNIFYTMLIFFLLLIFGCSDNPTDSGKTITMSVQYYHPSQQYTNGYITYSSVASITWNGGSTTVANAKQYVEISVPEGATLTAKYSSSRLIILTTGRTTTENKDYSVNYTAAAGAGWKF